jgi:tetratricopeptide (TPR) repeat protein
LKSPSLSAALIVKDGGDDFVRCLASLANHVDEIVVVDTGSTDGSLDAARAAGAKVHHFDWVEDFAAARNVALAEVRTDWFLSIDADEELICDRTRSDLAELFSASSRVLLDVVDAHNQGAVKLPRLFKRVEGTHWQQPIHETLIQPGVHEQIMVDASEGISILHHGYREDLNPAKLERNLRILRAHLQSQPDDPGSLFFLARECAWSGRFPEGLEASERLLETADLQGQLLSDALAVHAWCLVSLRRYSDGIEIGREARRSQVPSVWTEYLLALAYANSGHRAKALEAIERACSMPFPEESMLALIDVWNTKRFELRRGILALMSPPNAR